MYVQWLFVTEMRLYQLRSMDWMWLISRAIAKWSNCNHPLYVPSIWRCLWPTRTTVCSPQWSMTKPQQTTVDWWRISAYRWEPDSFNWWLCSGTWGQHHAIEQRIRAPVDLDNRSSILFLFLSPRPSSCMSCCTCRCFSSTSLRFRSSLNAFGNFDRILLIACCLLLSSYGTYSTSESSSR